MKIAIVGFPGCGKSTCFKAISEKTKNETEKLDPTKPHIASIKILDQRLEKLKAFFNPKKLTYAEIIFEDLPGFHIPHIKEVEALMEVLGIFSGSRDPMKDIEDMDGDSKAYSKTIPIRYGQQNAWKTAKTCAYLVILASLIPLIKPHQGFNELLYGILIVFTDAVILLAFRGIAPLAQRTLVFSMTLALIAFLLGISPQ